LYQKIENYVTSEEFDYAFFIAQDENLKHVLTDVYDEVIARSMKVKITKQPNGIYSRLSPRFKARTSREVRKSSRFVELR